MKIAVLINNYNYEAFVGNAIRSVLNQTYPDVQCIVVDDGSTDKSRDVIREFKGIRVIEKPNGGQNSAVYAAFEACPKDTDIVFFLDADDQLYPNACEEVAKAYQQGVSMVQFRLEKKDTEGNKVGEFPDFGFRDTDLKESVLQHGVIPASPTSGNAFSYAHVARMMQTIDPVAEGRFWIDGYLIYSAPFTGSVVKIDKPLGMYLVHGSNVSMAGGRTHKSVTNAVRSAVWQRKGFARLLLKDGPGKEQQVTEMAERALAAHHYRNALLLRRAYGDDHTPSLSTMQLVGKTLGRFMKSPYISPAKKAVHMALVLAMPFMPRKALRRLAPKA